MICWSLNPRLVGQVFRRFPEPQWFKTRRLNPRLVGQVFRQLKAMKAKELEES